MFERFGEVAANFSLQIFWENQKPKIMAENQCEKHQTRSLAMTIFDAIKRFTDSFENFTNHAGVG